MSNTLTDKIFAGMQARSTAYQSAFDLGVLIGRREMKPLIRDLLAEVQRIQNIYVVDDEKVDALLARAKEALGND